MLIFDDLCDGGFELNIEVVGVVEVLNEVRGYFGFLEKIDLMVGDFFSVLICESERVRFKLVENNIEDRIFGKIYRRKVSFFNLSYIIEDLIIGVFVIEFQII